MICRYHGTALDVFVQLFSICHSFIQLSGLMFEFLGPTEKQYL